MQARPAAGAGSFSRVRALFLARLSSGPRGGLPVAALLANALVTALFCGLVSGSLPPFAYGLFSLTLMASLLAIPLLGDLGWLLRADPARAWVEALPAKPRELSAARALQLVVFLGALALAALLPVAFFGPGSVLARLALIPLGFGVALCVAATLVAAQALLGGRAESALVLLQTGLVVGVLVGLVAGLRHVPTMKVLEQTQDLPQWLWILPSTWFAAAMAPESSLGQGTHIAVAIATGFLALAILVLLPAPKPIPRLGKEPLLAVLLRPIRALITRTWVRADERGFFDLVYDALPLEREVVLRTYPMLGIPLAFLAIGSGDAEMRTDVLALLFFSSAVYLPVLLTQIPASESAAARWIHELSPAPDGAVVAGTIKALIVRFLVPLYAVLLGLAVLQGEAALALRLGPPGFLLSCIVLVRLYGTCVSDRPLSVPPDEIRTDLDWAGMLMGIGMGLAILAFIANRMLVTPVACVALYAVPALLLWMSLRAVRLGDDQAASPLA
ncbi:MAG: hypothetical protein ACI8PQ_001782 [Planctomycetota bacterium]|jgi:hypothetical protein